MTCCSAVEIARYRLTKLMLLGKMMTVKRSVQWSEIMH